MAVDRARVVGDFDFVVDAVSRNYSGYPDKVTAVNEQIYSEFTDVLRQKFADADSLGSRLGFVSEWLSFFADLHLSLSSDHLVSSGLSNQSTEPRVELIDDRSSLVRIPSFLPEYLETIKDLMSAHHDEITRRINLIIDLRGNSGGSDDGMEILLPYVHSGQIEVVGADVRSSVDNARYLREVMQMHEFPDETKRVIEERAAEMERHPDRFVDWVPTSTVELGEALEKPRRVGVVVDRHCASTTEQFLILATQSSKVVIFGENTAGCIDYSNVVSVKLPSGEGTLNYPITRSKRVGSAPIDGVGIAPDVTMDPQAKNLIAEVARVLDGR